MVCSFGLGNYFDDEGCRVRSGAWRQPLTPLGNQTELADSDPAGQVEQLRSIIGGRRPRPRPRTGT
jgi:hypothetical protein